MKHKKLKILLIGAGVFFAVKAFMQYRNNARKLRIAREKAEAKYNEIKVNIKSSVTLADVSSKKSQKIFSASICELSQKLDQGKTTCEEIFLAYTHQLRKKSLQHNCILDVDIIYGLRRARKLDQELKQGKKRSTFHGIPVSIKDIINVKNMVTSYGTASLCRNTQKKDSFLVKALKKKGAVIYVKSSMPQNAKSFENVNEISGTTTNLFDCNRSSGGSSGGDAVLVATSGTCLGIGTDLVGGLRFPAVSCGVYTLKPTSLRVPKLTVNSMQDFQLFHSTWGPFTRNIDDLVLFFQEFFCEDLGVLTKNCWDQSVFDSSEKLVIGWSFGSELWPVPDCMKTSVDENRRKLEEAGHSLIELDFNIFIKETNELLSLAKNCDLEKIRPECSFEDFKKSSALPIRNHLKRAYELNLEYTYGEKESLYHRFSIKNSSEYIENYFKTVDLRKQIIKKLKESKIDAILFPCPFPAILHGYSLNLEPGLGYYALFNILDFPVGILPTGPIKENEQVFSAECEEKWKKTLKANMKNSKGLPTGLQIVGMPFKEETVLRIMKELVSNS